MTQVHVTHPEQVDFKLLLNPAKKGVKAADEAVYWYGHAANVFDLIYSAISGGYFQGSEHKIASLAELSGFAMRQLAETQGEDLHLMARYMSGDLSVHEERKQAAKGGTS